MVASYCPRCWEENALDAVRCAACGASLQETRGDIVLRYIDALRNPEPTRASLACTMLGQLGDRRAMSRKERLGQARKEIGSK